DVRRLGVAAPVHGPAARVARVPLQAGVGGAVGAAGGVEEGRLEGPEVERGHRRGLGHLEDHGAADDRLVCRDTLPPEVEAATAAPTARGSRGRDPRAEPLPGGGHQPPARAVSAPTGANGLSMPVVLADGAWIEESAMAGSTAERSPMSR